MPAYRANSNPGDEDDDLLGDPPQSIFSPPASPAAPAEPVRLPNPVLTQGYETPAQPAAPTAPPPQAAARPQAPAAPALGVPPPAPVPAAAQATQQPAVQPDTAPDPFEAKAQAKAQREAHAQATRDNNANLRSFKAQGGATQVTPTGQTAPVYDEAGNPTFKPGVIHPLARLEDGRAYRVSRNAAGAHNYFDLEDGEEGQDFHTDPHSGEKFVTLPGADGGSRREVIGQDALVPKFHAAREELESHRQDGRTATAAIARAEAGHEDAEGLAALPLSALRKQQTAVAARFDDAQNTLTQAQAYFQRRGGFNAEQEATAREAKRTVDQLGPHAAALDEEIQSRENVLTQARQMHASATERVNDAGRLTSFIAAARNRSPVLAADLASVLTGGGVAKEDEEGNPRAELHHRAGLMEQEALPGNNGQTILRVSAEGLRLLPADLRRQVAANPERFNLSQSALEQVRRQAPQPPAQPPAVQDSAPGQGETVTTSALQPSPLTDAPDALAAAVAPHQVQAAQKAVENLTGLQARLQAKGETLNASQAGQLQKARAFVEKNGAVPGAIPPTAPAQTETVSGQAPAASAPGAPATPKPYSVGQDGKVQFDPTNPTASVQAAIKDGTLDPQTAEASLAAAKRVEAAHGRVAKFLEDHPQIASAAEGISNGGAFWAGGKATTLAATASGLNPTIAAASVELGPLAWIPPALAAGAEFVGGGLLGVWAKKKVEAHLAEYSDALKALQSGAQAHPTTAAVAELATMLPAAVASVGNLARVGGVAAKNLGQAATAGQKVAAGATAIAKTAAPGAAGGAVAEGVLRPAISYGADAVLDAAGVEHDPTEAPTIGSIAQMTALGGLLGGHGLELGKYSKAELGSILNRGRLRVQENVAFNEPIAPEKIATRFGSNPSVNSADVADLAKPLSPAEWELYWKAENKVSQLKTEGKINSLGEVLGGNAEQFTRGGAPIGVASVEFQTKGQNAPGQPGAGKTTNLLPSSSSGTPPSADRSPGLAPAAPASPASAPASFAPTTPILPSASVQPAASVSSGQVPARADDGQQPPAGGIPADRLARMAPVEAPAPEPASPDAERLATLTRQRDDARTLLDAGRVAPEAIESTRAILTHLDQEIGRLRPAAATGAGSPPASSSPAPGESPAEPAPPPLPPGQPAARPSGPLPAGRPALPPGQVEGRAPSGPPSQVAPTEPAAPTQPAPEPTTPRAKRAAHYVENLERIEQENGRLEPGQRQTLTAAREALAEERAKVAADPAQTSAAPALPVEQLDYARRAVAKLGAMEAAGEPMTPGQRQNLARQRQVLAAAEAPTVTQETPKPERKGSTQLTLPEADAKPLRDFAASIPDADVYKPETTGQPGGHGRETEPHITSLYGLTGEGDNAAAVARVVAGHGQVPVKLGKLSVFSNPKAPYDVLKVDVQSPVLHRLNAKLRELPHQNDYPKFSPHLTIAYLQKGAGAKYVGDTRFAGKVARIGELTHSSAGREKTSLPLASDTASTVAAATFKPRQEVTYRGRAAVVEKIENGRATIRVKAGQSPTTGANLIAKRVTNVDLRGLQAVQKPSAIPAAASPDKAPSFNALKPAARELIAARVAALESTGKPVPHGLKKWYSLLGPTNPTLAKLSAVGETNALAGLRALDTKHGLGIAFDAKPAAPADGLNADALERAYAELQRRGMDGDEAAHRLGVLESARDAGHAVEQVLAQRAQEQQARAQEQAEAQSAADTYLRHDAGGTELLDAIEAAGGLPTVGHAHEGPYRGELNNIRENARAGAAVNHRGTFTGKLFRKDAPPLDELVRGLRDRGFPFETADDLFNALDERLRTGKGHFGFAEASADAQPRAAVPSPQEQQRAAHEAVRLALADAPDVPTDRRLVKVATFPADLPAYVREHPLASRAEAFWDPKTDTIHFLPWNLSEPARATELLRHELFHRGLKLRYAKEYADILDTAAKRATTEELAEVARDYEVPAGWEKNAAARRYLAEELLARRVEAGEAKQGWLARLVSRLRELLRALKSGLGWSDADIAGVLRRSVRAGQLAEWQAAANEAASNRGRSRFAVRHERDAQGNVVQVVRRGVPEHDPLLTPTHTLTGRKRELQRAAWVRQTVEQGKPVAEGQRPILWLMGGGSGAGKSTLRERLMRAGEIPSEGTAVLDSDELKKFFPEYRTLLHHNDPAASTVAHRESAMLLQDAFAKVLGRQANAVLDGTMSYRPHVEKTIQQAKAAGYEVRAVGVTVHPETALARAEARARKEGRDVPTRAILERVKGFAENFEEVAPMVDRWELHDNNGVEHQPVATREGERMDIHDPRLYDEWRRSANHDYEEIRRRFTPSQAADRRAGRVDQEGSGAPGGGGPQDGLARAKDAAGVEGASGALRTDGAPERVNAGPGQRTGPVEDQPRFSLPPLEQKPYDWGADAPPVAGTVTVKPQDPQRIYNQAKEGWKLTSGLFGKKIVNAAGKTVAIGHSAEAAAKSLLGQHAWSVVHHGGNWHAVDELGTSLFEHPDAAVALKEAVGKLLGELAVKQHLAGLPPSPPRSPDGEGQAAPSPSSGALSTERTRTGRELPPGLKAPVDPANQPGDARLEEAQRQAAAVPMETQKDFGGPAAPNGQVSSLSEPQWRQVRTPLFKDFFGDWQAAPAGASKIVDEKGEPRIMYRGTKGGREPAMRPNARRQIYLSEKPEFAEGYGHYQWETFVNARNPWDYQNPEHLAALRAELEADPEFRYHPSIGGVGGKDKNSQVYQERLQAARASGLSHADSVRQAMEDATRGDWTALDRYPIWEHLQRMMDRGDHDGVWITEAGARNLIVPGNTQVKSATHNEGTFDPSNPDTRFSVRRHDPEQGGLFESPEERAKREERAARAGRARQPEPAFDLGDARQEPAAAPAPAFRDAAHVADPGDLGLRAEETGGQSVLFSARPAGGSKPPGPPAPPATERTLAEKILAGAKESLNLPRAVMSSMDVSAVLRQGGFIGFGNPQRALSSIAPMFRALVSEEAYQKQTKAILARPNAPLYEQAGLYLAETGDVALSAKEESIMSDLADRIPGVKASNRAYVSFLNHLRADSFDAMAATLSKSGTPTKEEMEAIANYVNVATGRGNMGSHAAAAETLATVFFSPRLMLSRFQILGGQPMYGGSARTRRMIAGEYAKALLGIGVVLSLGALAGASVELDPRSSDFAKLKFGNTRLDPLAGLAQATVLMSRLATGETKKMSGELVPIRGDNVPFGSGNSADLMARFIRTKLAPVVGAGVDVLSGKTVVGEKVVLAERKEGFPFVQGTVPGLLLPLGFRDIYDVMKEQGVAAGTAMNLLALFGMGLQQYDAKGTGKAGGSATGRDARAQLLGLAKPFREAAGKSAPGGSYAPLRKALDGRDEKQAQAAILDLLKTGKTLAQMGRAVGFSGDGKVSPQLFTGSLEREEKFRAKLTPEQRKLYVQAFKERQENAALFRKLAFKLEVQRAAFPATRTTNATELLTLKR